MTDKGFVGLDALTARIRALGACVVAIDGPCASGKSSLAARLQETFAATVLHADDFFLRPEQRTEARLSEPGGNFDRERFLEEALSPLCAGAAFVYRPYDCRTRRLLPPVAAKPARVRVVEGAYCLHPDLADRYDLKVFVRASLGERRARLLRREGEAGLRRFEHEWIPLEDLYFDAFQIERLCDFVVDSEPV